MKIFKSILLLSFIFIIKSDPSCINPNGAQVDWFITLKLNNGDDYAYCDSKSCDKIQLSGFKINDAKNSPILRTLQQIKQNLNNDKQGYLLWNDQPPNNMTATSSNAHAKGFISLGQKSGFILIHSVPEFPAFADSSSLKEILLNIEESQQKYGQHFLCTSTSLENLEKLACGYNIDNPKVYSSFLPYYIDQSSYPCLNQMKNNKRNTKTKQMIITYSTLNGETFTKFSKNKDNQIPLYEQIVTQELKTGLLVQSWGRPYEEASCSGSYQVVSNTRVQIDGAPQFKDTQDHSKYGISIDKAKPFVCLGDINRMKSQWKRGGGTICISNKNIHFQFTKILQCSGCTNNNGYEEIKNDCDPSCQNCKIPQCQSGCKSCLSSDSNICIECDIGFYLDGNKCSRCQQNCEICTQNGNICTQCIENFELDKNSQCIPTCDQSCLTCSQPQDPDSCLSCSKGSYLTDDNNCKKCISPCTDCEKGDKCTQCEQNYILKNYECLPICDKSCLTCSSPKNPQSCLTCEEGYYLNKITNECMICGVDCAQCLESADNCTTCKDGFSFNNKKCIKNEVSKTKICHISCLTCTKDSDPNACSSCPPNLFLTNLNTCLPYQCDKSCLTCSSPYNPQSCLTCKGGYYLNKITKQCMNCGIDCAQCIESADNCTACKDGYILKNQKCVKSEINKVKTCHNSCLTCTKDSDPNSCLSCPPKFFLSNLNTCLPCQQPCSECKESANTCTSCLENYFLEESKCQPIKIEVTRFSYSVLFEPSLLLILYLIFTI
ncbi:deoxyribonuclease II family protein (macronuclear) [Tetrahymena thermophila SB210]|uniref:Deoxyribonuclease II family protein n=1 Tax=Tetrahymena thermophila (strain SB210) TaxID=312017 RepID=Q22YS8_TETTS|nr:deoxyribonuclease II family protein [Tetrahymena thermophila SB210]EAR90593.2 deoxyribonuclease II family protein [Tetrahymena thermophila SB210]|eukprot:XP_001010838.2 deoxyribonuclease II family protein [Tetrahymena thermophila SB210]